MKKSLHSLELEYSITPNLDILKKLDYYKWNQSLIIQNWKTLSAFQVLRGHSHAVGAELPGLKYALYLANPPKISMLK
jgi:hypothetical protein